jgi:hypothetical protein
VKRICLLAVLVGALAFLTLGLPAAALAGTYSWNLASDFTAAGSGANPDHDQYGTMPWSYQESSPSGLHDPSTFTLLPSFATGVHGGLAAWSDPISNVLVGVNPGPASISDGSATYPPGQVVVAPGSGGQLAVVGWTSPLSHTTTVSISGSVGADSTGSGLTCTPSTMWSLDQNGISLVRGTTPTSASTSFTTPATVDPGASLYLTVATAPGAAACGATGLSLQIRAAASAPVVTLTDPASGAGIGVGEPAFSGAADTDFGVSSQVTLRIYAGSAVSGTPVQTMTTTASGGTWTTRPHSPLAVGVYTAQAEQDDRASPTDAGFSAPRTVTVSISPSVVLLSPGSKPLTTSMPTLSGTAGTAPGDNPHAFIHVFAGSNPTGATIRDLKAKVGSGGKYSAQVIPALADGVYTAQTMQGNQSGAVGSSSAVSFVVDAHAPAVTLVRPRSKSISNPINLIFQGRAGTAVGDFGSVAVLVYRGSKVKGKPLARINVSASGANWSARWGSAPAPGMYTARAAQHDGAGHTGLSAPHTFRIVAAPPVVSHVVTIGATGRVSLQVACLEPPGDTCSGTVLVLTKGEFQPAPGGPSGRLSVIFAHVNIEGGHNHTVTHLASPAVVAALRGLATVPVTITASLRPITGKAIHAIASGELRHVGS